MGEDVNLSNAAVVADLQAFRIALALVGGDLAKVETVMPRALHGDPLDAEGAGR